MTKFSENVSNDKICNCTAIPRSLLIGYHLVLRYSESLAVPPISLFGGTAKNVPHGFLAIEQLRFFTFNENLTIPQDSATTSSPLSKAAHIQRV